MESPFETKIGRLSSVLAYSDFMMSISFPKKVDSLASSCLTVILKNLSPSVQNEFKDKLYCKLHEQLWRVYIGMDTSSFVIAESEGDVIFKMSASDEFRENFLLEDKKNVETWTYDTHLGYFCVVCNDRLPEEETNGDGDILHLHDISEVTDTHWVKLAKFLYAEGVNLRIEKVEIIE